jgi:hypothetical protein
MYRGLKAFKKEFRDFSEQVPYGGHKATRDAAKKWFEDLVQISPVDTGFFRSKWRWSVGRVRTKTPIKHPHPGRGTYAPPRTPAFTSFKMGTKLYIYNNVVYGPRLEDGYSRQAPRNFFRNAAIRARYDLQRRYDKLKWRNGKLKG